MEPTLSQALSSVLGAAVPSAARPSLLAAALRPAVARPERVADVIELASRRQPSVPLAPERPSAA